MSLVDRILAEQAAALHRVAAAVLLDPSTAPASATDPAATWAELSQAAAERAEELRQFTLIRRFRTIKARAIATDIDCHRKPASQIAAELRALADWIEQTADRDPTEAFIHR